MYRRCTRHVHYGGSCLVNHQGFLLVQMQQGRTAYLLTVSIFGRLSTLENIHSVSLNGCLLNVMTELLIA